MPESVDTPAPVSTAMRRPASVAIACATASVARASSPVAIEVTVHPLRGRVYGPGFTGMLRRRRPCQDERVGSFGGVSAEAYARFMGRFSTPLAVSFADAGLVGVSPDARVLDVGCGPGMLTAELVRRRGADAVVAVDPEP